MNKLEIEVEGSPQSVGGPSKRQISNVSLPEKKSDIGGTCANLVNSIVGAGIIGMPYALKESGLVAGVILLILVSYFTDKTLRLLVELAHFHPRLKGRGVLTFEDLMSLPFGSAGNHFILASMLVTAYGAMVAYLLIIKDTVPTALGFIGNPNEESFMEKEMVMLITSLLVVVPLSMQRDMSSLAFTSLVSCIADTILVFFVSAFSPVKESVQAANGLGNIIKSNWINSGFFIGFGVLTVAMTCQHSAFIVSGSLINLNSKRWAKVSFRSLFIAMVLCALLGICGYLGFLDETQGDILNNFDPDTLQATVARLLLAFTMFFTYPMEALVARHVLMQLLFNGDIDDKVVDPTTGESVERGGFFNRRVVWTIIIYVATLLPALVVDDLGPVLSLTGALGGCCLAYIGPGLAFLGTHGESFLKFSAQLIRTPETEDSLSTKLQVTGNTIPAGPKPWWWNITLMPIWVKIAQQGAEGMDKRLSDFEGEYGPAAESETSDKETIGPSNADYFISIFFIVFGVIAGVAGILSNVYAQFA